MEERRVGKECKKADIAASFQAAVVAAIVFMTKRALKKNGNYKSIGLCGGVAQNTLLRESLQKLAEEFALPIYRAEPKHCGDNAAMVAFAAWVDGTGVREAKTFDPGLTIDQIDQTAPLR